MNVIVRWFTISDVDNFSVLEPSDAQIRYTLFRRENIAKVLLALSEEPCYLSELTGRLSLSKQTVIGAVRYLSNCGLIHTVSENHRNGRVRELLSVKRRKLTRKLHPDLADNVLKRMDFFYVTQKAEPFLNHARKCVFGGEE